MNSIPQIDLFELSLAALFIFASAMMSFIFKLKVEKFFLIGALRSTLQLGLIGIFLKTIFLSKSPTFTLAYMLFMTLAASFTIYSRSPKKRKFLFMDSFLASFFSAWIIVLIPVNLIASPSPWYHPQFYIPLLGMLLGNSLNGITLALTTVSNGFNKDKHHIEELLSLGATKWEASRSVFQEAMKVGTMPITNAMMVSGLVSLPGMMTGQILAGASPVSAAKYQLFILFLISAASFFGTLGSVYFSYQRSFTEMHQIDNHTIYKKD